MRYLSKSTQLIAKIDCEFSLMLHKDFVLLEVYRQCGEQHVKHD